MTVGKHLIYAFTAIFLVAMTYILGISAFYHDSAAVLMRDGEIVGAAQEERFSRVKHDSSFPAAAISYCLREAGISASELSAVGFYEKPLRKFHRLLETYAAFAPVGIGSFAKAVPLWLRSRLHVQREIRRGLGGFSGPIMFADHHESHAAAAFFPSPFERAAVLTVDGAGEWSTTAFGTGQGNTVQLRRHIRFPHSLGLLYSAFTYYLGFKVNSGEYKVMGLAPYGDAVEADKFAKIILRELIDLRADGSFRLNLDYFNFCQGLTMTNGRFHALFGGPPRQPSAAVRQRDMDLALAIQQVTETAMLGLARHVRTVTGEENLCLAGGVALNCVVNGRIVREKIFQNVFIQPAAGDAGGALGVALLLWHKFLGQARTVDGVHDRQRGSCLGPAFSAPEIEASLRGLSANYVHIPDRAELDRRVAELLRQGQVVGWFQGRLEYGPRALGARSILADPRNPEMQRRLNLKIKFRESFRPFAPVVLAEHAAEYFDLPTPSPYMLLVGAVRPEHRRGTAADVGHQRGGHAGLERLHEIRSDIPAVTHVDFTARVQTVDAERQPRLHALLQTFHEITACPVLVNTSFNIRGEPIVCTPEDAYRCYRHTQMDALVIGDFLLVKASESGAATDVEPESYRRHFGQADAAADNGGGWWRSLLGQSELQISSLRLRIFGISITIGLSLWAWVHSQAWLAVLALLAAGLATLRPGWLYPLHAALTAAGRLTGAIIQYSAVALVFYGVLTPLGLIARRWSGAITRHPDSRVDSYWEDKTDTDVADNDSYYRMW